MHSAEFGAMVGPSGGPCWPSGLWGGAGRRAQGAGLMRVPSLQYASINSLDHIDSEVSVPLGTGPSLPPRVCPLPGTWSPQSLSSACGHLYPSCVPGVGFAGTCSGGCGYRTSASCVLSVQRTAEAWDGPGPGQRHFL